MTDNKSLAKTVMPLFLIFILINSLVLVMKKKLPEYGIDTDFLTIANCILFVLCSISVAMHKKACESKNPNMPVRAMMLSSLIKILVVAIAMVIYIYFNAGKKVTYNIYCGMAMYVVYTFIDVRISTKLKKQDGNN